MILALETAIGRGSAAILFDGEVVVSERGGVTRGESLVESFASLTDRAGIGVNDLKKIAVSVGPGSYTGIRIGISTALGLHRSMKAVLVGIPVLEALAEACTQSNVAAAVPIGRSRFAVQKFDSDLQAISKTPHILNKDSFLDEIRSNPSVEYVSSQEILEEFTFLEVKARNLHIVEFNLAEAVGRYALARESSSLQPIYA